MADSTPTQHPALQGVQRILAVSSCKGGVGKSTTAVNTALSLARYGLRVGLLDADIYGPSLPTLLRPENPTLFQNQEGLILPLEVEGLRAMSFGWIDPEQQRGAAILRGPMVSQVISQLATRVAWGDLDYLVIDLPPGTGDIQLTLVQSVPLTGAVMVTTPQEVAVADAVKAMNMFRLPSVNVPILGVVENMSWFTPKELPDHKYFLFGEGGGKKLTKMANSVLLGQVPLVQGIREAGDAGKPAVAQDDAVTKEAFLNVARNAARQIVVRNETMGPTQTVKVDE